MKNRVHEIRKKQGWTLRGLSQETGLSRNTINNIERGITNPRIDTLEILAETFDVGVKELLVQKRTINTSDYPQKTKEEYMEELQEAYAGLETRTVRHFYILTLSKLGIAPKGGVVA